MTSADQYTSVAAPTVNSLSPASGEKSGGNRVIIHGTHLGGATGVRFGTKLASQVHFVSSTQITVIAPSGQGTVNVTVTSIGGTSTTGAASRYRY